MLHACSSKHVLLSFEAALARVHHRVHWMNGYDALTDCWHQGFAIMIVSHMLIHSKGNDALYHDGVLTWRYFLRYWPFVRGIHRSPLESPQKRIIDVEVWCFFYCQPESPVEQIVEMSVVWEAKMFLWCHYMYHLYYHIYIIIHII